jgi:hypothetical protein
MAKLFACSIITSYASLYLWLAVGLSIIWSNMTAHALLLSASRSYLQIWILHRIIGCIYNFKISLTIIFIWAVWIVLYTVGSDVKSKCCLFTYYFAVFNVFLYASLSSLSFKAFLRFYVSCFNDYNFCAATIALIWATSPKGVVIKEVNIFGSVNIFWFKVIGSFGFLNYV